MSEIRVTYSGLIGLIIGFVSIFTGLVFSLVITRTLTPNEYGTWSLIGSIVAYFIISENIISYWTTRQIARGENVGKTAVLTSAVFSLGVIPLYFSYVIILSSQNNADPVSMGFGAMIIPVYFVSQTIAAINRGYKPHAKSFGLLTFELLKIPTVLVRVYFLELGINGVIFAVTIAYSGKIIVQLFFAKPKLSTGFNRSIIKRWFKLSWLPLFVTLHRFTNNLDIVLFSLITGSVVGIAYYHAAYIIAAVVAHSGMVSQALFPKLLAGGSQVYIKENFRLLLYFAIPILGIAIILSKPVLFALNPIYAEASIVVILLALKSFFSVLISVLYLILVGIEKVDIEKNPRFLSLLKSKLFFVPKMALIHSVIYIISLVTILSFLNSRNFSELELVTWWAMISLILEVPFFIYMWIQTRKNVDLSFPYSNFIKYSLATVAFVLVYFMTSDYLITYEISIYDFLPGLLAQVLICVMTYLLITYIIDKKTKMLFKSVINELFHRK